MVDSARIRVSRISSSLLVLGALAAGLVGCTPVGPLGDPGSPTALETTAQDAGPDSVSDAPAQLVPGGGAEANLPFFSEVLRQFAAGPGAVEGQPIVDALIAAGFDRAAMQVSFDRSKTELVADSILVSVLFEGECLIGQVVTADRSFVTTVAPALTESQNLCLIGNTRPIDW